jgi:hypothetical protein
VFEKWIDRHFKLLGVLLVGLAALNAWMAYKIFLEHPIMAFANGTMAVVITLGVILSWGTGETK